MKNTAYNDHLYERNEIMKALLYILLGATAGTALGGYIAFDLYAEEVTRKSLITKETYKKIIYRQTLWTLKNWDVFASDAYSDEFKEKILQAHADVVIAQTLLKD